MSTASTVVTPPAAAKNVAPRVAAIDIFRGLTMLVMIFVNDVGEVKGLPWWTYHAHAQWDVMTYVDMVFPFFLFIVGMSMPLAFERRLSKNPSQAALWLHVAVRSFGLIILGLILANAEKVDPARTRLSGSAWALLGLTGAIFVWLVPSRDTRYKQLYRALRIVGVLLLIVVYAIFRRTTESGATAWIDGSYPEILGLIGYTYFATALLYIPTRRWLWAPLVWFVMLTAFCALETAHLLPRAEDVPLYFWPFSNGSWASITMAGVVTSIIFLGAHRWQRLRDRMLIAIGFAAALLIGAWLLAPLGISKIRATPTWCLASVGAAVLVFALLHWICDVKATTKWAFFVKPAGENTLLTYLLPDIYGYLMALVGFRYFESHLNAGLPGVVKSIVFTFVMLGISALLTQRRIRLHL
jgi:heparan-alpha-glucosaminide N-acetyltransferase